MGRFTSPDSIIPEQSQGVQAWDRYAYVNNSPVRYNDPSGHCLDPDYCRPPTTPTPPPPPQDPCIANPFAPGCFVRSNSDTQGLNTSSSSDPSFPSEKFIEELEAMGIYLNQSSDFMEAIEYAANYGRPAYKQVKGIIPFGPFLEGSIGAVTQFTHDVADPNIRSNQYFWRAMIVGGEDAVTDLVATPFGALTGGMGGSVGASVGGPAGGFFGSLSGFAAGSSIATHTIDTYFWAPINQYMLPWLFP